MRNIFIESLVRHAATKDSLFLITGDLGFGVIEPFFEQFPERFLNAGVAEQSMVGVAAGLAETGRHVFVYSIANFPTFRALEQIRNDVAYHRLPVTIVSVGAGLGYGTLGYTHHAVEDIAVMRALPNMTVYSPADAFEVEACLDDIVARAEPSYLRLGKGGESLIHKEKPHSIEAGLKVFGQGGKVLVLSTGEITASVLQACEILDDDVAKDIVVFSLPVLKNETIARFAEDSFDAIVTVEEHSVRGGLGSLVAEIYAPRSSRPAVLSIGLNNTQDPVVGSHSFLRNHHGLSAESIAAKLQNIRKAKA